jgi:putative PIN family toxin of toxin-antitoxin system
VRTARGNAFRTPVVVLDTNVAVPGVIGYRRVPPAEAVCTACVQAGRAGRIQLAFSPAMLEELLDVLQREPFALTHRTARRNVRLLEHGARLVKIPRRLSVLKRDPDDNVILETALAARADYLVTWNLDDFAELNGGEREGLRYRGVRIVAPGELLRALRHAT